MKVSAIDENGNAVDWWFIYKVPQLTKNSQTDSTTGYEYIYFDSEIDKHPRDVDPAVKWKSPNKLTDNNSALKRTLNSIFNGPSSTTGWILYNDEKPATAPGKDSSSFGHTKGVIGFDTDSKSAFWLLHSWPKYASPDLPGMPTPMYGQTFLCMSVEFDTANKIAALMVNHQEPQCFLPRAANLAKTDDLYALTQPLPANPAPAADVLECKTAAGMSFRVLAKNREWNDDFWNDFVGLRLGSDMDVETWIRGAIPPVADSDGIHKTFDIKYINLGFLGLHCAWPETHDHAKWGITTDSDWVCVGDINRMISQRNRGGGAIAFQNRTLWQGLSRTDLILAPPGHTRDEALGLIQRTHTSPDTTPAGGNGRRASGTATPAGPPKKQGI